MFVEGEKRGWHIEKLDPGEQEELGGLRAHRMSGNTMVATHGREKNQEEGISNRKAGRDDGEGGGPRLHGSDQA